MREYYMYVCVCELTLLLREIKLDFYILHLSILLMDLAGVNALKFPFE